MAKPIIAVDFDGTLCDDVWPNIGNPHWGLINLLKAYREGISLILWTCRTGRELEQAVKWCEEKGLDFDAINANLWENVEAYDGDNRKIYADLYIDDHACQGWDLNRIENVID